MEGMPNMEAPTMSKLVLELVDEHVEPRAAGLGGLGHLRWFGHDPTLAPRRGLALGTEGTPVTAAAHAAHPDFSRIEGGDVPADAPTRASHD